MSTRGVIARKTGDDKFAGRYNHSDSYPSGLGRDLWNLYKVRFPGDLQRMLEHRMLMLASYSGSKKMIGAFGLSDLDASWCIVADICLNSSEPDWEELDG